MKIMIIGARPAGLSCARVFRERGAKIAVFEAAREVSGV
jgi:flavin-dependent dehydrogenase